MSPQRTLQRFPATLLFVVGLSLAHAQAQDMIAVGWNGQMHALDSYTGVITPVGNGLPNQNAAARDDHGRIWSTAGATLSVLDPTQPGASVPLPGLVADLRGLANAGAQYLWGIENGPVDLLVRLDKVTGAKTVIGPTGYAGIEGLEQFDYSLYAWDTTAGLLRVSKTTGLATDVDPNVGSGGASIAWLSTRSDGKLIGGQNALYTIEPTTGAVALIASLGGQDLRGADAWQAFTRPFGTGCAGSGGIVTLGGSITGTQSLMVRLQSDHHAPNAIGATLFGLSNRTSGFGALPHSLDAQFGTVGCTLYTSVHASVLGVCSASPSATLAVQVPFTLLNDVFAFYVQQVTLESVPGGMALSNGLIVQLGR